MTATTTTYRRTRQGEWVVFGDAALLEQHAELGTGIEVTKRDGTTKREEIDWVGKHFEVDGRTAAYGHLRRGDRRATAVQSTRAARRSHSHSTGRRRCFECDAWVTAGTRCDECGNWN